MTLLHLKTYQYYLLRLLMFLFFPLSFSIVIFLNLSLDMRLTFEFVKKLSENDRVLKKQKIILVILSIVSIILITCVSMIIIHFNQFYFENDLFFGFILIIGLVIMIFYYLYSSYLIESSNQLDLKAIQIFKVITSSFPKFTTIKSLVLLAEERNSTPS